MDTQVLLYVHNHSAHEFTLMQLCYMCIQPPCIYLHVYAFNYICSHVTLLTADQPRSIIHAHLLSLSAYASHFNIQASVVRVTGAQDKHLVNVHTRFLSLHVL
jgi:hypothetical protein